MSDEEWNRKSRQRYKNKMAAMRCREKKRLDAVKLEQVRARLSSAVRACVSVTSKMLIGFLSRHDATILRDHVFLSRIILHLLFQTFHVVLLLCKARQYLHTCRQIISSKIRIYQIQNVTRGAVAFNVSSGLIGRASEVYWPITVLHISKIFKSAPSDCVLTLSLMR